MSDDIQREKDQILRDFEQLQRKVTLTGVLDTISQTSADVAGLPDRIQSIRDKGYAFAGYLEGKAETLAKQWEAVERDARDMARRKTADLDNDWNDVQDKASKLEAAQGLAAKTYINQLEPAIKNIEGAVAAAESQIEATFGEVPNNVRQTVQQLHTIEKYVELTEQATFDLIASEAVFMAVDAEWDDGKDKPDGIFYITDHRILMEQKEKTGKTFGLFGGKMAHEVLWESPIGSIDEVAHENKGMFGGKDIIHITFGAGGPYAKVTIEVKGGIKAEWFATQLKRAATGGLEKERGLQVDQELVDAVANAPTICPVCGATFDQPIVAGMTQIKCTYCGGVTRLAL